MLPNCNPPQVTPVLCLVSCTLMGKEHKLTSVNSSAERMMDYNKQGIAIK
jgi:hypothetical protein